MHGIWNNYENNKLSSRPSSESVQEKKDRVRLPQDPVEYEFHVVFTPCLDAMYFLLFVF
jgi:hypothetical protein